MTRGFTMAGGPVLQGGKIGPEIQVADDDNPGNLLMMQQLSGHTAHKTLGHYYITPAGTNKKQLEVLNEKSHEYTRGKRIFPFSDVDLLFLDISPQHRLPPFNASLQ